jgi:hypothetical protein
VRNKMKPVLTIMSRVFQFRALLGSALVLSLAACGGSKWHEVQKTQETGDIFAEQQRSPDPQPMKAGDPGFVTTDHLPVRRQTTPKTKAPDAHLERNDKVVVTDENPDGDDGSLQGVVVDTQQPDLKNEKVTIPKGYLAHSPVVPSNEDNSRDKYFMIQNIATQKVRLYRNCVSKDAQGECVHKMVLETDMTAGEDTPDKSRRTILGSYRLEKWFKFYEDHAGFFPSYYAPGLPNLPKAGASLEDWMSPKLLPKKGGVMRGSFGWYTAYLEPNANNQWTHGTFGRGKDGSKFIELVKDPSNENLQDVRSQGCTRVENQAIALFREILPPGTRILKIYAKEGYGSSNLDRYKTSAPAQWSWVLTKKNGDDAPKSGMKYAPSKGHEDEILDRGVYTLDQMPTAIPLDPKSNGRNEENGNVYNLPESSLKGVFLIDEGRIAGYSHPKELKVGGMSDHSLPSVVISNRVNAKAAKPLPPPPVRNSME